MLPPAQFALQVATRLLLDQLVVVCVLLEHIRPALDLPVAPHVLQGQHQAPWVPPRHRHVSLVLQGATLRALDHLRALYARRGAIVQPLDLPAVPPVLQALQMVLAQMCV